MESRAKIILAFMCCMVHVTYLFAQQDAQYSQQILNPAIYNPAYSGLEDALSATAQVRSQWVGIQGHPIEQNLQVHSPLPLLHGGIGLNIQNVQEGAARNTFAQLSLSYIVSSRVGKISFGVSGGIEQQNVDGTKLRAPEGDYNNMFTHNDNILPEVNVSGYAPQLAAGIFFAGKNLSLGFSVNHFIPFELKMNDNNKILNTTFNRSMHAQLGYRIQAGEKIKLIPMIIARSQDKQYQAEGDLLVYYNNFIWIGAGCRGVTSQTQDAMIGFLGIRLSQNFKVGYSYDCTISALNSASNGSHEILVNYTVNLVKEVKPGKIIYTPRY